MFQGNWCTYHKAVTDDNLKTLITGLLQCEIFHIENNATVYIQWVCTNINKNINRWSLSSSYSISTRILSIAIRLFR